MPIVKVKALELSYNYIRLFNIFQKVVISKEVVIMDDSYKMPVSLRPIILKHTHRVKWNYGDTYMNSCGIR